MKIIEFKIPFDQDLASYLKSQHPSVENYCILSQSLDARKAPQGRKPHYLYRIAHWPQGQKNPLGQTTHFAHKLKKNEKPIVIVGAGPAGLFAALRLLDHGVTCLIVERGDHSGERMKKIARYWRYGQLDEHSNVCFGEGGAGLYSDGKLITRIKSDEIPYVMKRLVEFGAPESTAYQANPHLGSNKIREIIVKLTDYLKSRGVEICYRTSMVDLTIQQGKLESVILSDGQQIECEHLILAAGHSAKDVYQLLQKKDIALEGKDFAVGLRVEHPRSLLDRLQYGRFAGEKLGAARYRLSYHDHSIDRGGYSFCMCPGGYVLNSSTDHQGLVTNGMSNYACNSPWSNGALVVTVRWGVDFAAEHFLSGLNFVQDIEAKAKALSVQHATGKELPALSAREFLSQKINWDQCLPKSSTPSKIFKADIRQIFPSFINDFLAKSLLEFDQKLPGFIDDQTLLIAPETRTSSPLRIVRHPQSLMSPSLKGLYPCGEGAGYAGGITSAAVDGINVASALINSL